jgi:hypothetical protein
MTKPAEIAKPPAPDQEHRRDRRDVGGKEDDDAPEKSHAGRSL